MIHQHIHVLGAFILVSAISFSCVTVRYGEGTVDYSKKIAKFQGKIKANPNDKDAFQELGIIYFQMRQYPNAMDHLRQALALDSTDAKTLFYYGMTLESSGETQTALTVYSNYSNVFFLSSYRKLMEGRYQSLNRELIKQELKALISQEETLGTRDVSSTTIAVFPLRYLSVDEQYTPLGTGLSEMMIRDLGQVQALRLVERIRMQELLAELKFAQSPYVDPSTAPRLGKLLRAGRIVGGTYSVSTENNLRMDITSVDIAAEMYPEPTSQSDDIANLFKIQKDLVFRIIEEMGITLTLAERERIQLIPTKSLEALLLYSKGLEEENVSNYKVAGELFRSAMELDPNFDAAKEKTDAMESLSLSGDTGIDALVTAQRIDPPPPPDPLPTDLLILDRLQNMGDELGGNFNIGPESRDAPEEVLPRSDLKLPPPPNPPDE